MDVDYYYILVENRYKVFDFMVNNYHVEKILSKEKSIEIIEEESKYFKQKILRTIVTNDESLHRKYFLALGLDDFKSLCNIICNKDKIKVNPKYFPNYNSELYKNFEGVLFGTYLSTTMNIISDEVFPYNDSTTAVSREIDNGWKHESEFNYFVTPERYINDKLKDNFSLYFQMKMMKISAINELFNINITDLKKWDESKGYYKYYDSISCKRFYIQMNLLDEIRDSISPLDLFLSTWSKFDKNNYLEVYAEKITN